ncbi:nickel-dependent hydrogenase large subunit [Anaeroselena agilis]|uniref:Nickel-dependent hydrogenase large subunit n=1 Tax=Anaeroselena agilis TaxID=3063788 RepID=A0ABU3P1M2_9FIRM|nr:nickel-dependent hydrogenase large subunit [Selenomonadales bacterium 4137-cl]
MARKTIFPMTRIHEPIRVDVEVEGGRVTDAWVSSHLYRGWEQMMPGRDVRDSILFTQRICGICSSAHAVADCLALQQATGLAPTVNGQHLINLILAADIIQNHLRHFYLLALPDYAAGPDTPPWTPRPPKPDFRLPAKTSAELVGRLPAAVRIAASAHELMAMFGAKAPHQQTIMVTGVTQQTNADQIKAATAIVRQIKYFIEGVHIPDVLTVAAHYPDYYTIGKGNGNFLSFGMFPDPLTGRRAIRAGVQTGGGAVGDVDAALISEEIRYSWYREGSGGRPDTENTVPDRDKPDAYSWTKAPRYKGLAFESGPLPRAVLNGEYREKGGGVMDRLIARAHETLKLCRLAEGWLAQLVPGQPSLRPYTLPPQGEGAGLTDVMRGALGHWLKFKDGKIQHHQVVTPTTWKFSPRDASGRRGVVEEALIGTPVADLASLVEVGRVVRSFDPCFTCAVHAVNLPNAKPLII